MKITHKIIIIVVSSVVICSTGIAGAILRSDIMKQHKPLVPPAGLRAPHSYPEGPEREAAIAKTLQFRKERREYMEKMIAATKAVELAANPERKRFLDALQVATDEKGVMHHDRLPKWALERHLQYIEMENADRANQRWTGAEGEGLELSGRPPR